MQSNDFFVIFVLLSVYLVVFLNVFRSTDYADYADLKIRVYRCNLWISFWLRLCRAPEELVADGEGGQIFAPPF